MKNDKRPVRSPAEKTKTIVLGGGCFWCAEAVFQRVKGVEQVVSGYAGGGTVDTPSYMDLHTGKTGHAEVVEITYDPDVISLEVLFDIYFSTHDPTTLNQPGTADNGPEYRPIILVSDDAELKVAQKAKEKAQEYWDKPLITEIRKLDKFHPADDSHQNFYNTNPNVGYCQVIINPKLAKFEKKFQQYLKD